MNESQYENLIMHQIKLMLSEKNLTVGDLSNLELLQYKYKIALMLLAELG